ncbi:MAG: hypothetical protein E6G92_01740 [Alphaproteobacteria bacterium]|nr:MAG: hypothetical protein E6G92_01740 [Alphaproteobacteria bacterium]
MVDLVRAQIVDTNDPAGRGRVKIVVPEMTGEASLWAETLRAGGSKAPAYKLKDVVMVAFEGGDPNRPIVLGALGGAPRP